MSIMLLKNAGGLQIAVRRRLIFSAFDKIDHCGFDFREIRVLRNGSFGSACGHFHRRDKFLRIKEER